MRASWRRIRPAIARSARSIREEAKKLAALGYLGSGAATGHRPLPNPREQMHDLGASRPRFKLADEHRLDEAAAVLRDLLRENPRLPTLGQARRSAASEMGEYDEAIDVYREAMTHASASRRRWRWRSATRT